MATIAGLRRDEDPEFPEPDEEDEDDDEVALDDEDDEVAPDDEDDELGPGDGDGEVVPDGEDDEVAPDDEDDEVALVDGDVEDVEVAPSEVGAGPGDVCVTRPAARSRTATRVTSTPITKRWPAARSHILAIQ